MKRSKNAVGRNFAAALSAAMLSACVGTSYSGPVEVTRFVAEQQPVIAAGPIAITLPEEMNNERARIAFEAAVTFQLTKLGYAVTPIIEPGIPVASVRTSRNSLAPASSRGPINVGVGGSTGSYGSGLGVGVGIDLGGNTSRPNALTELSVRISDSAGNSLWEGRAQQAVSINSPYADVNASARALSAALFKDFPGGNGETVTVALDELQEQK